MPACLLAFARSSSKRPNETEKKEKIEFKLAEAAKCISDVSGVVEQSSMRVRVSFDFITFYVRLEDPNQAIVIIYAVEY